MLSVFNGRQVSGHKLGTTDNASTLEIMKMIWKWLDVGSSIWSFKMWKMWELWKWNGRDTLCWIKLHVAFKWVWFGKELDVGSSVFLFFWKIYFYCFIFYLGY